MNLLEFGFSGTGITDLGISFGKHQNNVSLAHEHIVDSGIELTGVGSRLTVEVILVHADSA